MPHFEGEIDGNAFTGAVGAGPTLSLAGTEVLLPELFPVAVVAGRAAPKEKLPNSALFDPEPDLPPD
jgi:hypothetical protein